MIPVNSIVIPESYRALCADWYSGQGCMLYAISSTGGLTTGTIRPSGCDTDEKWYYSLWRGLSVDVARARRAAFMGCNYRAGDDDGDGEGHDADYPALCEFEEWVDDRLARLAEDYDLEDWEG